MKQYYDEKDTLEVFGSTIASILNYVFSIKDDKSDPTYGMTPTNDLITLLDTTELQASEFSRKAAVESEKAEKLWKSFSEKNPDVKKVNLEMLERVNLSIQDCQKNAQSYLHESKERVNLASKIRNELALRKVTEELDAKMIGYTEALRTMGATLHEAKKNALEKEKKRIASELTAFRSYAEKTLSEHDELAKTLSNESIQSKIALLDTEISKALLECQAQEEQAFEKIKATFEKSHSLFFTGPNSLAARTLQTIPEREKTLGDTKKDMRALRAEMWQIAKDKGEIPQHAKEIADTSEDESTRSQSPFEMA